MSIIVSTIIPAYNAAQHIRQCVDSVAKQGLESSCWECIIVNDGSTDSTLVECDKISEQYPNNIKVINKPNGGVCSARNAGLRAASGKYVQFLDADDYLVSNAYKEVLKFEANNLDYLGFWMITLDRFVDSNNLSNTCNTGRIVFKGSSFEYYKTNRFIASSCCGLYNRNTLLNNNIFFKDGITVGEDTLFNMKFALLNSNWILTSCVALHYVAHPGSAITTRNPIKMRAAVYGFMDFFHEIHLEKISYPNLSSSMDMIARHQIGPMLSRALSSEIKTSEFRLISRKIKEYNFYPVCGRDKIAFICNLILSTPFLFPVFKSICRSIFIPFILPHLPRN